MQTITRKYEDFDDLVFEVDLSDYGKTGSDVTDIIFSVKDILTDDDDSLFKKTFIDVEITKTGTTILTVNVQWPSTEYSQFIIDKIYKAGLFIKFTGDALADEHVDQIFDLIIVQDFLRG